MLDSPQWNRGRVLHAWQEGHQGSPAGKTVKSALRRSFAQSGCVVLFSSPELIVNQQCGDTVMGKGFILWLLGVPVSVIILIALFTTFI
ncbi:MAG: hypothetical protein Q8M07_01650 [Prosthecobacter sp.]|nr:hypothetical protein [Prosthecobacter sp.]